MTTSAPFSTSAQIHVVVHPATTSAQTSVVYPATARTDRRSSAPSALTESGATASSITSALGSTRIVTSSPPLQPFALRYRSKLLTPNDTNYAIPTSAGCSSSMTTTSMLSQGGTRRSRSHSMPPTNENAIRAFSGSIISSESSPVGSKRYTYSRPDPKDHKHSPSAAASGAKKVDHEREIFELSLQILTENSSAHPNAEPYFKLVLLLAKENPRHKDIIPTLDKIISHRHFPAKEKIIALLKKADFYKDSRDYSRFDKNFKIWSLVEQLEPKLTVSMDIITMQLLSETIDSSRRKLKKKQEAADTVISYYAAR